MKRRLLYPYHFNFGTSRTQEHKQNTGAYKTTSNYFNMEEQHNLPPNKRTCSRKETNALQADEDTIPYSERTIIIAPTTQEEIIPFNMNKQKRPLPYKDNLQQGRAIICPISHYKGASSTTYHQLNKKSTHGK